MKHEKAIGWMMVKKQCIIECPDDANDASKEIIEAYNMAIEALEKQSRIVEQLKKIAPQPKTECYAHVDEYLCALEMHEKCMAIVKGVQNE